MYIWSDHFTAGVQKNWASQETQSSRQIQRLSFRLQYNISEHIHPINEQYMDKECCCYLTGTSLGSLPFLNQVLHLLKKGVVMELVYILYLSVEKLFCLVAQFPLALSTVLFLCFIHIQRMGNWDPLSKNRFVSPSSLKQHCVGQSGTAICRKIRASKCQKKSFKTSAQKDRNEKH